MIPLPKSSELWDRFVPLLDQRSPDQFELGRLRFESTKLVKSGGTAADGHVLLGALDALAYDSEGFFDHFRVAQNLSPERYIQRNFSLFCFRMGFFSKAVQVALDLAQLYPDDLEVLTLAHSKSAETCQFAMLRKYEKALLKLDPNRFNEETHIRLRRKFSKAAERMALLEYTEGQILERLDLAGSILRAHREPIFSPLFDFGLAGNFSIAYMVKVEAETSAMYSFEIAENLLASFTDTLDELVTISTLPFRNALPADRLPDARAATQP